MYDNRRLILSIFYVVLGAVLSVLSIAEVLDSSMYAGFGAVLIVVGALQTMRNLRYRKDPDYREKVDTEISDERNKFLQMKSWHMAGITAIIVEGIGVVAAMVMGQHTVQLILSYSVCLLTMAYWISYLILSRKY